MGCGHSAPNLSPHAPIAGGLDRSVGIATEGVYNIASRLEDGLCPALGTLMVRILGNRRYVEIPGDSSFELPPLMLKSDPVLYELGELVDCASSIVDSEALIPGPAQDAMEAGNTLERVRFGLAANLVDQYRRFITHWTWGESVLEWIRQCETSFETQPNLRALLRPDLWPHAGRSSFVTLLKDKGATDSQIVLENAMGYRITFRHPPPIECFSEKFLFLLSSSLGATAYRAWAGAEWDDEASLPPERFQFIVMTDKIREV